MFARQFVVALKMVSYLQEVVTQALKIDVLRSRGPPKMKVALLQIRSFKPDLCPARHGYPAGAVVIFWLVSAQQDPADQVGVVAGKDLAFQCLTLRYGQTPNIRIYKIRRSLIYEVTTVLFQGILAVSQMRHDRVLITDAFRNAVSLRQVLLVHFVALFVARRRVPLFRQIVVSIATSSLDYKVIRLFEKILWLVNELVFFVAWGGRIECFRFLIHLTWLGCERTIFCALPDLALTFVPDRISSILPLVFQQRLNKLILFRKKWVVVSRILLLKWFLLHGAHCLIMCAMALLFKFALDFPRGILAAHELALVVVFALGRAFFSQWGQEAIDVLALVDLQVLIYQSRQRILLSILRRSRWDSYLIFMGPQVGLASLTSELRSSANRGCSNRLWAIVCTLLAQDMRTFLATCRWACISI